ncbi:MAG: hypothetical protein EHM12_10075 [Dehalococcoidia bacterium]|nr:MAG: hypothetical protein EHM12_10075 [Dehalococcoidia bacterium]
MSLNLNVVNRPAVKPLLKTHLNTYTMSPELQRLAGRALMDRKFRDDLLADPEDAVNKAGLRLSPDEKERLKVAVAQTKTEMTSEQLEQLAVQLRDGRW